VNFWFLAPENLSKSSYGNTPPGLSSIESTSPDDEDEFEVSEEERDEMLIAKALHQTEVYAEEEKGNKFALHHICPSNQAILLVRQSQVHNTRRSRRAVVVALEIIYWEPADPLPFHFLPSLVSSSNSFRQNLFELVMEKVMESGANFLSAWVIQEDASPGRSWLSFQHGGCGLAVASISHRVPPWRTTTTLLAACILMSPSCYRCNNRPAATYYPFLFLSQNTADGGLTIH